MIAIMIMIIMIIMMIMMIIKASHTFWSLLVASGGLPRSNAFEFVLIRPLLYITPALQYTTPANRCVVLPSQTRTCVSGAVNELINERTST